jgi:hypothetical protein
LFVNNLVSFDQGSVAEWMHVYNTQTSTIVNSVGTVSCTDYYLPPTLPNTAGANLLNNDLSGQTILRWSDQQPPISFASAALNTVSMSLPVSSTPQYLCNAKLANPSNYNQLQPAPNPNQTPSCSIVALPGNIMALGFVQPGNYWISYYSRMEVSAPNTISTVLADINSGATYAPCNSVFQAQTGVNPFVVNSVGPYLYTTSAANTTLALEVFSGSTDPQSYLMDWAISTRQAF